MDYLIIAVLVIATWLVLLMNLRRAWRQVEAHRAWAVEAEARWRMASEDLLKMLKAQECFHRAMKHEPTIIESYAAPMKAAQSKLIRGSKLHKYIDPDGVPRKVKRDD